MSRLAILLFTILSTLSTCDSSIGTTQMHNPSEIEATTPSHVPVSKGGWSSAGDMISGNADMQVSLQQTELGKAGAFSCFFSLSAVDDISAVDVATIRAEATIEWSVEGNTVVRKISVTDGAAITGFAQGVRVTVRDATTTEGGAIVVGKRYRVGVLVAPGTRPATEQPPILQQENIVFVLAGGASQVINIPKKAGVKSLLVTVATIAGAPIADGAARVVQTTAASTSIATYDPRTYRWTPIAPGATQIVLENFSGVSQGYCVFWGIDG